MKNPINWFKSLDRNGLLIILVVIALIVNLFLMNFLNYNYGQDLEGQIKSPDEVKIAGIRSILFGFPLFSIILGSILGLFLSKKKTYKERFINSSLFILLCLYSIFLIFGIRNIILW